MNLRYLLIILSTMMTPMQSLSIPVIAYNNANNRIEAEIAAKEELERQLQAELEAKRLLEEKESDTEIVMNNTLDLDGYCTIRIPNKYFEVSGESTFTKKVLRYKDKKSKVIMGYVTGIGEGTDIPGYIVREAAGLDIVTNSKYDEEMESGAWTVVPANKVIDNNYQTVYYIVSKDENSAFWVRTNVYEESVGDEFDKVIHEILNTYSCYYGGGTVFETPETGYYGDGNIGGDDTIANTDDYSQNTGENTVFNTGNYGYDVSADIGLKWSDMEVLIDNAKVRVPCLLEDIIGAGFELNDDKVVSTDGTYPIEKSSTDKLAFTRDGVEIDCHFYNESNSDMKDISECTITKIEINTTKFISKSNEEVKEIEQNIEKALEEDAEEDTERISEKDKVFDLVGGHSIVLPGKVMINIYVQDLLDQYGDPSQTIRQKDMSIFIWEDKEGGKQMTLGCGLVKNIKYISMSSMNDSINF